jgi:hypothetical protein
LPVGFIVPVNAEDCILKSCARLDASAEKKARFFAAGDGSE